MAFWKAQADAFLVAYKDKYFSDVVKNGKPVAMPTGKMANYEQQIITKPIVKLAATR